MALRINLQEIDETLAQQLREEAEKHEMSLNAFALHLLQYGLNALRRDNQPKIYHDLDDLAGTWTAEEAASFEAVIAEFEVDDC